MKFLLALPLVLIFLLLAQADDPSTLATKKNKLGVQKPLSLVKKNLTHSSVQKDTDESNPLKNAKKRIEKIKNIEKNLKESNDETAILQEINEISARLTKNNIKNEHLDLIDLMSIYFKDRIEMKDLHYGIKVFFSQVKFNYDFYKYYLIALKYAYGREYDIKFLSKKLVNYILENK